MRTAVRLVGYGAALALAFGASWTIGAAVGAPILPADPAATAAAPTHAADAHGARSEDPTASHHAGTTTAGPGSAGLVATAAGYTLVPQGTTFTPGRRGEFSFTVTGSDARPVQAFDVENEQQVHLIVVRRDGTGFQHLHPTLGPDAVWRVPLELPAAGVYRAYADFVPTGGPPLVLGTDLFAAGEFDPVVYTPSRVSQVGDYQVRLDGDLVPGAPSQIFATVSRGGTAVTDLQPYLGAFGHLVALRTSDLAYTHVHPDAAGVTASADRSGPGIAFTAEVPTAGSYRLYLDFQHDGVVRTAEFAVDTRDGT